MKIHSNGLFNYLDGGQTGLGDKGKKKKKEKEPDNKKDMKMLSDMNNGLLGTSGLMYTIGEGLVVHSYMELVDKISAYTGFSKVHVGRALSGLKKVFKGGGKVTFVAGSIFTMVDAVYKYQNGDYAGTAKGGLDIAVGVVGFAGPIGATIGGVYFIIDFTVGWDNAIPSYITVEKNKAFMRNNKLINFSDFKN